jgi:inositol oxygenase
MGYGELSPYDRLASRRSQLTDTMTAQADVRKYKFRQYDEAPARVKEFYRLNHENQTLDFVREMKRKYTARENSHIQMTMWDMMQHLNTLVDESDPDVAFTQIEHAMQTAERIRADGHPEWMVVTGFVHDAGKVLAMEHGVPQWAVVGDTFPVGCAFQETIVYPEFFADNPDTKHPVYSTPNGIYDEHCGLDNVHLSFGHDECLYHVVKGSSALPEQALAMIRYHSFYAWHREGGYTHLTNEHDDELLPWVQLFNPYDLYSKGDARPDVESLEPFYEELVGGYFPEPLLW